MAPAGRDGRATARSKGAARRQKWIPGENGRDAHELEPASLPASDPVASPCRSCHGRSLRHVFRQDEVASSRPTCFGTLEGNSRLIEVYKARARSSGAHSCGHWEWLGADHVLPNAMRCISGAPRSIRVRWAQRDRASWNSGQRDRPHPVRVLHRAGHSQRGRTPREPDPVPSRSSAHATIWGLGCAEAPRASRGDGSGTRGSVGADSRDRAGRCAASRSGTEILSPQNVVAASLFAMGPRRRDRWDATVARTNTNGARPLALLAPTAPSGPARWTSWAGRSRTSGLGVVFSPEIPRSCEEKVCPT